MSDLETAVTRAHDALTESAAVSKRAVAAHKRALHRELAALKELRETAARLGIRLRTEEHQGQRRPK